MLILKQEIHNCNSQYRKYMSNTMQISRHSDKMTASDWRDMAQREMFDVYKKHITVKFTCKK